MTDSTNYVGNVFEFERDRNSILFILAKAAGGFAQAWQKCALQNEGDHEDIERLHRQLHAQQEVLNDVGARREIAKSDCIEHS